MLGAAGVLVTDGLTFAGLGDFPKFTEVGEQSFAFADTTTLFLVQMILMSFAEHKRLYDLKNPGSQGAVGSFIGFEAALGGSGKAGYPGKAFDPLNLAKDPKEFAELQVKEIKNGARLVSSHRVGRLLVLLTRLLGQAAWRCSPAWDSWARRTAPASCRTKLWPHTRRTRGTRRWQPTWLPSPTSWASRCRS